LGLYRQFFDRFNFANHTYNTVSFGGHISAEVIPQTARRTWTDGLQ
jgi:hypothetical protein